MTAGPSEPPAAGSQPPEDWITLARVVKTQGRKGELAVEVLSDVPGRFDALPRLSLLNRAGQRHAFTLTRAWPHKQWLVLQLAEVQDLTTAETWVGAQVQVPRAQRVAPPPGHFPVEDLIGCRVFDGEHLVGLLVAIEPVPAAADLLHVEDADGREVLIPFVDAYVREIAVAEGAIRLALPEGLTGINHDV